MPIIIRLLTFLRNPCPLVFDIITLMWSPSSSTDAILSFFSSHHLHTVTLLPLIFLKCFSTLDLPCKVSMFYNLLTHFAFCRSYSKQWVHVCHFFHCFPRWVKPCLAANGAAFHVNISVTCKIAVQNSTITCRFTGDCLLSPVSVTNKEFKWMG